MSRNGKKDFNVDLSAAIFSDINGLRNTEIFRQMHSQDTFKGQMSNIKDHATATTLDSSNDDGGNFMRIMSDTRAAIHIYPPWYGEDFPITEANQRVTSSSGADINMYGRRTVPLLFKESAWCCFIVAFLVCGVTSPTLSASQLLQQGYGR